jgi:hypothetical protein
VPSRPPHPARRSPRRRLLGLLLPVALGAAVVVAPPAAATVTGTLRAVEEDFSATSQRSFALPAGRQAVTATVSLDPQDTLSQDWRCTLQTVNAAGLPSLLDEATVRVQEQVAPIPQTSNALPHLTLHGVVNGPVVLRFGCTRVAGSGVAPSVDRLDVLTDRDTSAVSATVTATTLSALPSVRASGLVRAVATVSLTPQDTRSGDLTCRLVVRRGTSELVATLDETVVRVRRTPAPAPGPSNALPRFTLAGLYDVGVDGTVLVVCVPVTTAGYLQPLVPRSRLVVQQGTDGVLRTRQDVSFASGDTLVSVLQPSRDGSRNPKTVIATLTLVPQSATPHVVVCRLTGPRSGVETTLDVEAVTVQALVAPDTLTSNAFPRITLIGTATLAPSTRVEVRCFQALAFGQQVPPPRVDQVTMVLLPTGSDGAL